MNDSVEYLRMNLVDKVHYAFNTVLSLKMEVAANQENNLASIHDIHMELEKVKREISTLTKVMREIKEAVFEEKENSKCSNRFIDNEAEEASCESDGEIVPEQDDDDEVIFVGQTLNSSKKCRFK